MSRIVPDSGEPREITMSLTTGRRTMRYDSESTLGALRQGAMLALSGFMLMSSIAAIGSACGPDADTAVSLESRSWQDSSALLVHSDQSPQPDRASCSSERASLTSGCEASTRVSSSDSTSSSRAVASERLPVSMSMVAYSNFAPVAKR